MKNILRTLVMLLTVTCGYGVANTGIIITNRDTPPKVNPCSAPETPDVGTILTSVTGIIITNLTGIIITNLADTGDVNCGIIIAD